MVGLWCLGYRRLVFHSVLLRKPRIWRTLIIAPSIQRTMLIKYLFVAASSFLLITRHSCMFQDCLAYSVTLAYCIVC